MPNKQEKSRESAANLGKIAFDAYVEAGGETRVDRYHKLSAKQHAAWQASATAIKLALQIGQGPMTADEEPPPPDSGPGIRGE